MRLTLTLATLLFASAQLYAQPSPLLETKDEAKLIAVIESDASQKEKADACRQLGVVGTAQAVPALAALLSDEKLSHMARYALEPIPDPVVDETLREAMSNLKDRQLAGVITSLGVRRDKAAVGAIGKRLADPNADVAVAAARALGRIGTPQAAELLTKALGRVPQRLRPIVADGCLGCAEALLEDRKRDEALAIYQRLTRADLPGHFRLAATQGLLKAKR
jgi:HEAT repeat protein